ncbi:uncharacterized protein LOC129786602 isoform X2 [Lutzomyia longipalpis]|uniref:uncharacterized protein LOC129786602 isoform X2 n=1 Tax=Lutzomyia longipalpis TaxID=7200 RepID=UPI002483A27B|nr:uncharacterized protein LOC129786602 isoform X2 [Lutzomyia longipalpis]
MKVDRVTLVWLFLSLTWIYSASGIYLQNVTKRPDRRHDSVTSWTDAVDEQDGLWTTLLTDWTVRDDTKDVHRDGRVLQVTRRYIPTSGFFVTRRAGEDLELEPHRRPPGKILDFSATPVKEGGGHTQREVSETDLYLLGAIEKLVYRVDYMEKRLRRTEQMLFYMMQGNNQREELCPENFTRAGGNCYHFGVNREINWKAANSFCKSMGAHLAEFETSGEYKDVAGFLMNHQTFKGKDFWLGGLNPGLLWIWSHSARPINPDTNLADVVNGTTTVPTKKPPKKPQLSQTDEKLLNIAGSGRCLRLTFDASAHNYTYYGQDCSSRQNYICEFVDRSLENEISRISRELLAKK